MSQNPILNEETAIEGNGIHKDFEQSYYPLRLKEQRVYSDEALASLPSVSKDHIHFKEWKIRGNSAQRLIVYLEKKNKALNILEIGCGNGWLSSHLANIAQAKVTGLDINITELTQASSVFKNKKNLRFIYGDIRDRSFNETNFDIIIFAASLQYFSDLKDILNAANSILATKGEIHILDTFFYTDQELPIAKKRSLDYFEANGFPGMSKYYFHHGFNTLKEFKFRVLYNPSGLINRLLKKPNPFYWFCINKYNS
jgi:SAM-dependent methyltransferase